MNTCSGFLCLCSSLKQWSGLCFEAFLVNTRVQKNTMGLVCKVPAVECKSAEPLEELTPFGFSGTFPAQPGCGI